MFEIRCLKRRESKWKGKWLTDNSWPLSHGSLPPPHTPLSPFIPFQQPSLARFKKIHKTTIWIRVWHRGESQGDSGFLTEACMALVRVSCAPLVQGTPGESWLLVWAAHLWEEGYKACTLPAAWGTDQKVFSASRQINILVTWSLGREEIRTVWLIWRYKLLTCLPSCPTFVWPLTTVRILSSNLLVKKWRDTNH